MPENHLANRPAYSLLPRLPDGVSAALRPAYRDALDLEPVGFRVVGPITDRERDQALAILRKWLDDRLEPDRVVGLLTEIKLTTAGRGQDECDTAAQLSVYATRCGSWPAAAVQRVLGGWRSKWWPSWAEIETPIADAVKPVQQRYDALLRASPGPVRKPLHVKDRTTLAERVAAVDAAKKKAAARGRELAAARGPEPPVGVVVEPEIPPRAAARQAARRAKDAAKGSAALRRMRADQGFVTTGEDDEREEAVG